MKASDRIGFMQGRLCDRVDGKIQAFPWNDWEKEFPAARRLGLHLMEWTLDHDRMAENPIMTEPGRQRIRELSKANDLQVSSLTGDNFMQAPFWKAGQEEQKVLIHQLEALIEACGEIGVRYIVVPFVDGGRIETPAQEDVVVSVLVSLIGQLEATGVSIVFESDYPPMELKRFLDRLPPPWFGVNYDIGNSAALGFDPVVEIDAYRDRILNVHVKDRILGGTTVPLGEGDADFGRVFASLAEVGYSGLFILQTARADDGDHARALSRYRDMVIRWTEDVQK